MLRMGLIVPRGRMFAIGFGHTHAMPSLLDDLLERAVRLEREIEHELNQAREHWRYRIDAGKVRFEQDVRAAHRRLKQSLPAYLRDSNPLHLLVAPVIYSLIVPIAILDVWISCYQRICFPIFGIALVRRSTYIVFDRQHLAYLNLIEKMNCGYCGYANGVLAYVREIAGRTEQYWCPIRHAKRVRAPHPHYREFVDYGDAAGYQQQLPLLRAKLKDEK
jgi:hypothetical protein